jgi:hypothetical protein
VTNLKELLHKCEEVLDNNWNGSFTIPSATLYPHQWSWDAGFIAIGNSYKNTELAIKKWNFCLMHSGKMGWFLTLSLMKRKKPTFQQLTFMK